ncbi:unnamed protein product [Miscanthus lutarioriparius]|uniref:Uncharacterized protein n=1 Tax=Miscanthus lutarioriparius TaxID=422564 RepID=A0A811PX56_9POAL|nr:unnamed protein product [Miscanthus lutarioriparius]
MAATPASRNHHAKQRQPYPLPTDPSKHVRRRLTASIRTAASQPPPVLPLPRLRPPPPAPSGGLTASVRTVAALCPAFGQLRRRPARAPPACTLPRTRDAACRAPMRHAAPTPLGRAIAPQQRPPASGHLPHGASSSHTPAAATGARTAASAARWRREAPSALRGRPVRWGQQNI